PIDRAIVRVDRIGPRARIDHVAIRGRTDRVEYAVLEVLEAEAGLAEIERTVGCAQVARGAEERRAVCMDDLGCENDAEAQPEEAYRARHRLSARKAGGFYPGRGTVATRRVQQSTPSTVDASAAATSSAEERSSRTSLPDEPAV